MAGLVYAVPAAAPPAPASEYHDLVMSWQGWDGSIWPLTDYSHGVYLGIDGIEGLAKPAYTQWTQASPSVPGQWFRGAVANERKVFWPLEIYSDAGSAAWVELERGFWRTMRVGRYGIWSVTGPTNETRTLSCRFVDDGAKAYTYDPVAAAWSVYGLTLVADQPYWAGEQISKTWKAPAPVDFFNGPGKAAPFNIVSGSTFANAKISNPGDVEAWPVWTIMGNSTSASVGIGSATVQVPFTVGPGKALVIDTDPTAQQALLYDYTPAAGEAPEIFANPVDRTPDLGSAAFAPIPEGEARSLSVALTGGGTVRAAITPLYERAWG